MRRADGLSAAGRAGKGFVRDSSFTLEISTWLFLLKMAGGGFCLTSDGSNNCSKRKEKVVGHRQQE